VVTVAQVLGVLLLLGTVALGYLAVRRIRLMRGGGVDVCLRRRRAVRDTTGGRGWHFGVGRYCGDALAWRRLTSFRPGPGVVIDRTELEILDRRAPSAAESDVMPQALLILRCRGAGEELELAMSPDVLTGFLAWLEASPPGHTYRRAS
jgi:hypothetical protein